MDQLRAVIEGSMDSLLQPPSFLCDRRGWLNRLGAFVGWHRLRRMNRARHVWRASGKIWIDEGGGTGTFPPNIVNFLRSCIAGSLIPSSSPTTHFSGPVLATQ